MTADFAASVNLLPWRQLAIRATRLRLARRLLVCLVLISIAAVGVGWQLQRSRETAIAESKVLRQQIDSNATRFAAAQSIVREIARWKGFAALEPTARHSQQRVLNFLRDLSAQSVTGIVVYSVEFAGDVIEVKGATQSKTLAVDFVRGLKARGWTATSPTVAASEANLKEFQFLIKPKPKKKK